jgi:hypothetical protein
MLLTEHLNYFSSGDRLAFKKTTRSLDFADLALADCLEQNRSIKKNNSTSGSGKRPSMWAEE